MSEKELIFGLKMLLLPGAKIRSISVYCMVVSDTRNEQNGGDMNEGDFRYRQLEMWLSLRGSKKEFLDLLPHSHLPGDFMLRPATYHALFPVNLYAKFVFRRLRFRRVRISADRLLGLRPSVRNVQNCRTDFHEIIVAPSNFPSSSSNIIATLRYCLCSHPCIAHAQHVDPVAVARTDLTTTWTYLQAVTIKLVFKSF